MFRRFGLFVCCIALASMLGGHWAVLQTVAWARMIRDYSGSEGSVAAGIAKTFGGEAPCGLCKEIARERQNEDRGEAPSQPAKKAESFLPSRAFALAPPPGKPFRHPPPGARIVPQSSDEPPVPIPISRVA